MSRDNNTVEVKKSSVWLIVILILVVAIITAVLLVKDKESNNNENLEVFTENPELFPSLGPTNSNYTVIEFSDFQCPYCALASGLPSFASNYSTQYPDLVNLSTKVKNLAADGEIRFIYVPMSFLGQESVYASEAALCANKQGKFWEMHDAIFKAHDGRENNGKYSKANLSNMAQNISGINMTEFNYCLNNDEMFSDVQEVADRAGEVVSSTPTFYVNGKKINASWSEMSRELGI